MNMKLFKLFPNDITTNVLSPTWSCLHSSSSFTWIVINHVHHMSFREWGDLSQWDGWMCLKLHVL